MNENCDFEGRTRLNNARWLVDECTTCKCKVRLVQLKAYLTVPERQSLVLNRRAMQCKQTITVFNAFKYQLNKSLASRMHGNKFLFLNKV